jgi:predicted MFS family arabinose efflux permease
MVDTAPAYGFDRSEEIGGKIMAEANLLFDGIPGIIAIVAICALDPRFLAIGSHQMSNPVARQPDDHSSPVAKLIHQYLTSAACPVIDHDVRDEGDVSSSARPRLSRSCIGIMAAAGGIAVANLYYNQPMLPDISRSFGVSSDVIAVLPMLTQTGYALGLFLFVPLGDTVDRHRLVLALLVGIVVSLVGLAIAPSLVWLDMASLTLGVSSVLAQVLVAFTAQLSPPKHRGRIVGTIQAGILAGILLARTVSGMVSAHLSWRLMFWLAAAMNLGLLVVLHWVLPRTPPTTSLPYLRVLWSLKDLWQSYPQLRTSSFIGALLFAAFSAFWSTLAFHLAEPPFGYGSQVAGLFGLLGAAGAASAPIAGRLTDSRGAAFTVAIGTLITAVAFVVLMLAESSLVMLALGVVVLDVGIIATMNGNQSTILSLAAEATSRTNTIYMVLYFVGGALGSYTGGLAWHHFDWPGVTVLGLLYSCAAVLVRFVAWMPAHRPPDQPRILPSTLQPTEKRIGE